MQSLRAILILLAFGFTSLGVRAAPKEDDALILKCEALIKSKIAHAQEIANQWEKANALPDDNREKKTRLAELQAQMEQAKADRASIQTLMRLSASLAEINGNLALMDLGLEFAGNDHSRLVAQLREYETNPRDKPEHALLIKEIQAELAALEKNIQETQARLDEQLVKQAETKAQLEKAITAGENKNAVSPRR